MRTCATWRSRDCFSLGLCSTVHVGSGGFGGVPIPGTGFGSIVDGGEGVGFEGTGITETGELEKLVVGGDG